MLACALYTAKEDEVTRTRFDGLTVEQKANAFRQVLGRKDIFRRDVKLQVRSQGIVEGRLWDIGEVTIVLRLDESDHKVVDIRDITEAHWVRPGSEELPMPDDMTREECAIELAKFVKEEHEVVGGRCLDAADEVLARFGA